MLAALPIRFDQPLWLLLLLLIIPAYLMSRRSIGGHTRTKAMISLGLRSLLLAGLAIALSHPSWERRGKGLTVTVLLDRSQSIPVPLKKKSLDFMIRAVELKERLEDRVAVITINKDAHITAMPDSYSAVTIGADAGDPTATNLAAGVRMGLAIAPDDTANRFVLVSDGNETEESVIAAAELARANDIPIDVIVLDYEYDNEVIFEKLVVPPRARQGQSARVRAVLRSQGHNSGVVRLKMNGEYLDLNGDAEGDGLAVELKPGPTALEQTISLDQSGPHEFEAVFIPDDPKKDAIERNNTAVGVTFVGGQGKVLIMSRDETEHRYLRQALIEGGVTVDVRAPEEITGASSGLVMLSGYDALIMVNVPRWALDGDQDKALHAYVHDLGGGLVMIGGTEAFGAGGWIDSEVAKTLPVKLNPPDTREMPAGALALVMHSCEMPQGNYWGQKVAQSAIEALSRLDYVGIVEFNWGGAGGIQGCSWAFPMQRVGDKRAALSSTKTMTVGDMPSFGPSMQLALQGLLNTTAAQRHSIIISDGDPQPPSPALLQQYIDNSVTVSTVMVGGHGTAADRSRMQAVAEKTGGTFYNVRNPKRLPKIFIKEARIVSRSLIQDRETYTPAVVSGLPGPVQGFASVPTIDGYVLTAQREGLAQIPILIPTQEGNDPLFAHWNYGLGRSVAYTSDVSQLWGSQWASWARFQSFWEQSIRWSMRPSAPTNVHVNTMLDGDLAVVEIEALDADASFLNFLTASAVVMRPDQTRETLTLQQVGPGRYRSQFRTSEEGAYLVNIGYKSASGESTEQGNIQAAVSVPYAREFRAVKHNGALLADLAARTGGRVLDASSPELIDLFDRGDLGIPSTLKRVWDLLAIIAAVLLIVDVAARRIAIDPAAVRAATAKAVGKRGDVSQETVAAWKRTRAQVASQRDKSRAGATAARANKEVRFEAEAGAPTAAPIGSDDDAPRGPRAPGLARPADTAGPGDLPPDEGDYTSRLLAAKRRARGGGGSGGGDDPDNPGGAGGKDGNADG